MSSKIASERLVALFLLGVLVLNPPFILIFDTAAIVAGIPVLYLYLFIAWAALILLLAFATELSKPDHDSNPEPAKQAHDNTPHDLEGVN